MECSIKGWNSVCNCKRVYFSDDYSVFVTECTDKQVIVWCNCTLYIRKVDVISTSCGKIIFSYMTVDL